ncbi:hypothetical protein C8J57DRAFT_1719788 [Mycena rebaudengoi]|nr:hypothetical protein C8J57DRAFT_1719788 [Mycena rebaudengoi]
MPHALPSSDSTDRWRTYLLVKCTSRKVATRGPAIPTPPTSTAADEIQAGTINTLQTPLSQARRLGFPRPCGPKQFGWFSCEQQGLRVPRRVHKVCSFAASLWISSSVVSRSSSASLTACAPPQLNGFSHVFSSYVSSASSSSRVSASPSLSVLRSSSASDASSAVSWHIFSVSSANLALRTSSHASSLTCQLPIVIWAARTARLISSASRNFNNLHSSASSTSMPCSSSISHASSLAAPRHPVQSLRPPVRRRTWVVQHPTQAQNPPPRSPARLPAHLSGAAVSSSSFRSLSSASRIATSITPSSHASSVSASRVSCSALVSSLEVGAPREQHFHHCNIPIRQQNSKEFYLLDLWFFECASQQSTRASFLSPRRLSLAQACLRTRPPPHRRWYPVPRPLPVRFPRNHSAAASRTVLAGAPMLHVLVDFRQLLLGLYRSYQHRAFAAQGKILLVVSHEYMHLAPRGVRRARGRNARAPSPREGGLLRRNDGAASPPRNREPCAVTLDASTYWVLTGRITPSCVFPHLRIGRSRRLRGRRTTCPPLARSATREVGATCMLMLHRIAWAAPTLLVGLWHWLRVDVLRQSLVRALQPYLRVAFRRPRLAPAPRGPPEPASLLFIDLRLYFFLFFLFLWFSPPSPPHPTKPTARFSRARGAEYSARRRCSAHADAASCCAGGKHGAGYKAREGYTMDKCDVNRPICGPCVRVPKDDPCEFTDSGSRTLELQETVFRLQSRLNQLEGGPSNPTSFGGYRSPATDFSARSSPFSGSSAGSRSSPHSSSENSFLGSEEPPLVMIQMLLQYFLPHATQFGFFLHIERFRASTLLSLPFGDDRRPSPALLCVVYLWGVHLSQTQPLMSKHEPDALSAHAEFHANGAATLALGYQLHKIRTTRPRSPPLLGVPVLMELYPGPPRDPVEEGERIRGFWVVACLQSNLNIALHSTISTSCILASPGTDIDTPWPLEISDYEGGRLPRGYRGQETVKHFLTDDPPAQSPICTLHAQASVLLHRASRLASNSSPNLPPQELASYTTSYTWLDRRITRFWETLPPLYTFYAYPAAARTLVVAHALTAAAAISTPDREAPNKCIFAARTILACLGDRQILDLVCAHPIVGALCMLACRVLIDEIRKAHSMRVAWAQTLAVPLAPPATEEVALTQDLRGGISTMTTYAVGSPLIKYQLTKLQEQYQSLY